MEVPIKYEIKYPVTTNTIKITTESVYGSDDKVYFFLLTDPDFYITRISWKFKDWGYIIRHCTPEYHVAKFPVTPPNDVNKTWEVIFTAEDVKIKCNTLEVLHFIFNDTYSEACTTKVVKNIALATKVVFRNKDTATKMLTLELFAGKWCDVCIMHTLHCIIISYDILCDV